jgi:HAD superfamily hydrolase (TIGR01484 family)
MKPFSQFPTPNKKNIDFILTDIDDTLTHNGRLPADVFVAMERLKKSDIRTIPITGRPAGWCDHIARMWPVDGLVGENGAFYFRYDDKLKKMQRRYVRSESQRNTDRRKLEKIKLEVLKKVSGCQVASDQAYREADLAIDFCEDVPPLAMREVEKIVSCFESAGAKAKISSIHVNGWFGDYDKLTMTRLMFEEVFGQRLEEVKDRVIFIGDAPNDSPMFSYFPHSVGVANVLQFKGMMAHSPAWVTKREGGYGFFEMVNILLSQKNH